MNYCVIILQENSKINFMIKSQEENTQKVIPPPSFIKLAMRNMVRKGSKSISHFFITFLLLLGILILLATLGKPTIPI